MGSEHALRGGADADDPTGTARFGWLLLLIAASVVFTMSAPAAAWGEVTALALQAGVLLLAVRAVGAPTRLRRVAMAAAVGSVLIGTAGVLLDPPGDARIGAVTVSVLGIVLVAAAVIAIVQHLLVARRLTSRTVLGALCVYMLIGGLFASAYAFVAAVTGTPFFAGDEPTTLASLEYFSFTTLTTLGYGDLVPAARLGRALAMLEALIGQIYLVTVVALLVGNLALPRRADDGDDAPERQEPA